MKTNARLPRRLYRQLGKLPDAEIARRSGLSAKCVRTLRHAAGIEAFSVSNSYRWTKKLIGRLGKVPDLALQDEYGIPKDQLAKKRAELGIPAYRRPRKYPASLWRRIEPKLGVIPDGQIAEESGIPNSVIVNRRNELGIPVAPREDEWTPEQDAQLGDLPDWVIARQRGVTKGAVSARRRKLQSSPYREQHPRRLPDEAAALLGKMSDGDLTRRFRIPRCFIKAERDRRGIPPFMDKPEAVEWTPGMLLELGDAPDYLLAEEWEISSSSVSFKREQLGIEPYGGPSKVAHQWTDQQIAMLGTDTDRAIGERIGLHASTVWRKRTILEIPAYVPPTRIDFSWTARSRKLIGTAPDPVIAKKLKIKPSMVNRERLRLGIPAYVAPKHRWKKKELAMLGVMADQKVADALGLRLMTVRNKRRSLGLTGTSNRR